MRSRPQNYGSAHGHQHHSTVDTTIQSTPTPSLKTLQRISCRLANRGLSGRTVHRRLEGKQSPWVYQLKGRMPSRYMDVYRQIKLLGGRSEVVKGRYWWGLTTCRELAGQIYDRYDEGQLEAHRGRTMDAGRSTKTGQNYFIYIYFMFKTFYGEREREITPSSDHVSSQILYNLCLALAMGISDDLAISCQSYCMLQNDYVYDDFETI